MRSREEGDQASDDSGYREFMNRWTTDGFRSYVGDLQSSVDRQLEASIGEQAREAEDAWG